MALEGDKELLQLQNRLRDLAEQSFRQNIFTFTGFLGLGEQDVFWKMEKEFVSTGYTLWGGSENSDRKILRFGSVEQLGYETPFPIVCLHIRPLMAKFAEELSHRDVLGALMNLGIERGTLGDIRVGDKEAYCFCLESIADYICSNLEQIRHTHIRCGIAESWEALPEEEPEGCAVQVASLRVDAVLAKAYHLSREESLELFRMGKVFVDGRLCENNSRLLKTGDVVNARGYGKFCVGGEPRMTRKGKLAVELLVYR